MASIFTKQTKNPATLTLVLDIRSSSVGGSVIKVEENKPIEIQNSIREYFYLENEIDTDVFIQKTEITLKKVLENLVHKKQYLLPITSVAIFYGAPWYKNFIENFTKKFKEQTEFTEKFLKELVKNDISSIGGNEEIIEKKLLSISLNGYHTNNPFGEKATDVDLSFYISILNKDTKASFVQIIRKFVKTKDIRHHSHTLTLYSALHSLVHAPKDYVLFDIGGEITEISVIRNNHLNRVISLPHGVHYFVRILANKNKYDFQTAFSELKNQTGNIIGDVKKDWIQFFQESLLKENLQSLPPNIFVSADEETRELFKILLEDIEVYYSTLKMNKKPEVHFLQKNLLKEKVHYAEEGMRDDSHLLLNSVFVELFGKKS